MVCGHIPDIIGSNLWCTITACKLLKNSFTDVWFNPDAHARPVACGLHIDDEV